MNDYPQSKEEFLEIWKDDPYVGDLNNPEMFRHQKAILMEGFYQCSKWRGGSREITLEEYGRRFLD